MKKKLSWKFKLNLGAADMSGPDRFGKAARATIKVYKKHIKYINVGEVPGEQQN